MSQVELPQNNSALQNMLNDAIVEYLAEMSTTTSGGPAYERMMALTRAIVARGPSTNTTQVQNQTEENTAPAINNSEPNQPEQNINEENGNNPKPTVKNNDPKGGRRRSRRQKKSKKSSRGKNTRRK